MPTSATPKPQGDGKKKKKAPEPETVTENHIIWVLEMTVIDSQEQERLTHLWHEKFDSLGPDEKKKTLLGFTGSDLPTTADKVYDWLGLTDRK